MQRAVGIQQDRVHRKGALEALSGTLGHHRRLSVEHGRAEIALIFAP
jgi:hypothetical protein